MREILLRNKRTGEIQTAQERIYQMFEDLYTSHLDPIRYDQVKWNIEDLAKEWGVNLPVELI